MAKLAHRRLVRHRLIAKSDLREEAHQPRVVQRLFQRQVGEFEPLRSAAGAFNQPRRE
jgi:hypothetical protein